ncbi:hypothetical protein F5888DRAFT_785467 [Russula emetica]|nr:hypothetical protein F5888DRAFT_785467 [Russula emetica]
MSSPSISPSPSSTTDSTTTTPSASGSSGAGAGAPTTATLLFGFLVIFAALFAGFLLLAFFWKIQQRRQTAFLPEFDDIRGSNRGVPKLWEVWIRDDPTEKEWNWETTTTTPLSVDVGRVPSEQAVSPPTSRSRRPWPYSLFRRRPARPPRSQVAQQQQLDVHGVTGAEEVTTGLISGVRVSFVIVMPHAETPDRRRSEISRVSQVVEQQQNWRRREYAVGIYHPSFKEGWTL